MNVGLTKLIKFAFFLVQSFKICLSMLWISKGGEEDYRFPPLSAPWWGWQRHSLRFPKFFGPDNTVMFSQNSHSTQWVTALISRNSCRCIIPRFVSDIVSFWYFTSKITLCHVIEGTAVIILIIIKEKENSGWFYIF